MSYTVFEDEEGQRFLWKDCEVPGCENQACVGLSDRWCWPHTMSGGEPALRQRRTPAPERCAEITEIVE